MNFSLVKNLRAQFIYSKMSVRDFFSNSVLKQSALEFLKNRANFQSLPSKYKRPFRGIFVLKNISDLNEK